MKRLLKKYKYPPEEQKDALALVMKQCEKYADSDETTTPDIAAFNRYADYGEDDYAVAAEPYEIYQWDSVKASTPEEIDKMNDTVLLGCYRDKKQLEWILKNKLYNIRLGKRKGSSEDDPECFSQASQLYLYDHRHLEDINEFKIKGHQPMSGSELKDLGYPRKYPGKSYMVFNIEEENTDGSKAPINLHDILASLDNHVNGAPVFIEPEKLGR